MAEGQQAEIAVDQIEAERIEAIDQNIDRKRGERHHQRKYQNRQAGEAGAVFDRELKPAHRRRLRPQIRLRHLVHALVFTLNSSIRRGRRTLAAVRSKPPPSERRSTPWPFPARTATSC